MFYWRISLVSVKRPWRWLFHARWDWNMAAFSSRRMFCRRTSRAILFIRRKSAGWSISRVRCFVICFWRTNSTARPHARSPHCWKQWRRGRSQSMVSATRFHSHSSSLPRRTRPEPPVRSCCRIRRWTGSPSGCLSDILRRKMNAIWFLPGRVSIRCNLSGKSFRERN